MNEKIYSLEELHMMDKETLVKIANDMGIRLILDKNGFPILDRNILIQEILDKQKEKSSEERDKLIHTIIDNKLGAIVEELRNSKSKIIIYLTVVSLILTIIGFIIYNVIGAPTIREMRSPDTVELDFIGNMQGRVPSIVLFDGSVMPNLITSEGGWIYGGTITNQNDVDVIVNEIWIELINFQEISDFSIISYYPWQGGGGGGTPAQVYQGVLYTRVGAHELTYLGHSSAVRIVDGIEIPEFLKLSSNQGEFLMLLIEFIDQVSGIYTFTVNISYTVGGEMKILESEEYSHFHFPAELSEHRYRNFVRDFNFNSISDFNSYVGGKIENVWDQLRHSSDVESLDISSDVYEMFERLLNPFSNASVIIDSDPAIQFHELYDGFSQVYPLGSDFLVHIENPERFILVEEEGWKSFIFDEERMIQNIRFLFASNEDEFSLPENARLSFADGSEIAVEISYRNEYYQYGESPYILFHGYYSFETAIPSYLIKIELLDITDYGETYWTATVNAW